MDLVIGDGGGLPGRTKASAEEVDAEEVEEADEKTCGFGGRTVEEKERESNAGDGGLEYPFLNHSRKCMKLRLRTSEPLCGSRSVLTVGQMFPSRAHLVGRSADVDCRRLLAARDEDSPARERSY